MPFLTPQPLMPQPLPANVQRVDPKTGLPTREAAEYEARMSQYRKELQAWFAALAAAIP